MNILKEKRKKSGRERKRAGYRGDNIKLPMKKLVLAAAVLIITLTSCSSVFTAYISGTLLDMESTENLSLSGITVYLYEMNS